METYISDFGNSNLQRQTVMNVTEDEDLYKGSVLLEKKADLKDKKRIE